MPAMKFLKKLLALAFAAAAGLPCVAATPTSNGPLILAVHPYLPATEILARFTPLADVLARAVGRPVVVRVGSSFEEHNDAIGTDSVDIAYMGPAPYVFLVEQYGPKPLLARQVVNGDPMLHGEIFVRTDSPIQDLRDLKGVRFAFVDPRSTAGHVVPEAMLARAGLPESTLGARKFLASHRNVALAVLAGDYDVGAVKEEVFVEFAPKGLRSIATQLPVPDHVLVTSTRLPAALVETLRTAVLQLGQTAKGRAAMAAIEPGMSEFVPVRDGDYDSLRKLMRETRAAGR
jgi:phosphonate transport system substrate-binding protein